MTLARDERLRTRKRTEPALDAFAESPLVRGAVGDAVLKGGNAVGVAKGVLKTAEDIKDAAALVARLFDVTDPWRHKQGDAAWDDVFGGIGAAGKLVSDAVRDPRGAIKAAGKRAVELRREIDPSATPEVATLSGEARRKFAVGSRQGEIGAEVASWVAGTGELKAAARIGGLSKAERVARHLDQGFSPAKADYLAERYVGKGHHSIVPERARLPKSLGGGPYPRWVLDSDFNTLEPWGISRGEMYELHAGVDRHAATARLPKALEAEAGQPARRASNSTTYLNASTTARRVRRKQSLPVRPSLAVATSTRS